MHYAVNLYDLMGLQEKDQIGALLFPPTGLGNVVEAELHKIGGDAAVLNFDEERAGAIVHFMRKKYKKYEFRLYQSVSGNGGWKRI